MTALKNQLNKQFAYNSSKNTFTMYKSKVSPSRRLKNMLKPLLGQVFKLKRTKQTKRSSYIASEEKEAEFEWLNIDMDNMANEHLEKRLINEIEESVEGDAIIVYGEGGGAKLCTMDREDYYVPVHFARTNAGTFFWTSLAVDPMEPYTIEWNFLDRWGQA